MSNARVLPVLPCAGPARTQRKMGSTEIRAGDSGAIARGDFLGACFHSKRFV